MYLLTLLAQSPLVALAFVGALIVAITVHEYAHAWAADRLGDDTPYLEGRLSLNPIAHLDPVGSIAFLILGFGWGKPVPYNQMRLSRRVDELLIALAGPASNLILATVVSLFLFLVGGRLPIQTDLIAQLLLVNVYLAAFNLLPIPPLDGSAVLAYFWPEYRSVAGGQIGIMLILLFLLVPGLLGSIMQPLVNLLLSVTSLFGVLS